MMLFTVLRTITLLVITGISIVIVVASISIILEARSQGTWNGAWGAEEAPGERAVVGGILTAGGRSIGWFPRKLYKRVSATTAAYCTSKLSSNY